MQFYIWYILQFLIKILYWNYSIFLRTHIKSFSFTAPFIFITFIIVKLLSFLFNHLWIINLFLFSINIPIIIKWSLLFIDIWIIRLYKDLLIIRLTLIFLGILGLTLLFIDLWIIGQFLILMLIFLLVLRLTLFCIDL